MTLFACKTPKLKEAIGYKYKVNFSCWRFSSIFVEQCRRECGVTLALIDRDLLLRIYVFRVLLCLVWIFN